ncbi:MAG TPA: glycerate kinase [Clostridia bacterium]|nr:glycerate kinase [Clostridia bacterium]
MKKIVLAPDSFKGTMSALEVCQIQEATIRGMLPDCRIEMLPMADGGEGMTSAYLALFGGEEVHLTVTGPHGRPQAAYYGILPDGRAVMEMAIAAGLPAMGDQKNPLTATTFGVGEMLLHAAQHGVKRVLLGLGGSATNDCGIGMASALGYRFLDSTGEEVQPQARNLGRVERIIKPDHLPELDIQAACDVDNPLCGPRGATYVFGPQKGADSAMLELLEAGMCHFAEKLHQELGAEVANQPGAGAAGGLGAAVEAFLGGSRKPGIEMLLDAAHFDDMIADADLVLTGEGRIDQQSIYGKVPFGVGNRCKKAGVPCVALCGSIGTGAEAIYDYGVTAIFSAVTGPASFEKIQQTCRNDMNRLTESVLRLIVRSVAQKVR